MYSKLFKAVLAEVGKKVPTIHQNTQTNRQRVRPMKEWNNTSL